MGNQSSWTEDFDGFFRQHFPAVARAAGLVVGSFHEGEEIAEESFVRLMARWDRLESPEHARNYVFKVALNLARSTLRRARRLISLESSAEGLDPMTGPTESTGAVLDRAVIAAALRALNPTQRALVVMVDYVGYDTGAAARLLRIPGSTARVYLTRGRRRLREHLGYTSAEA